MALKYSVTDLNDVPPALRDHYSPKEGGGFTLALDGHPDTARVAEFRDNNIRLTQERDSLKTRFDGIDPAAARAALAKSRDADPKVAELEAALATERAARTAAEASAGASVLKAAATAAFIKAGGRPNAAEFIVSKAAEAFTVKDGAVTTNQFSPLRPGEPLNLDDFMVVQAGLHDFAFQPSSGGGTRPSRGGQGSASNELVDPTPQQLGAHAADIAAGRIKVRTTN